MDLPNDIIKFIAEFLSPITILLVLRRTCKKMHKLLAIKKEFKRIMNDICVESDNKFTYWDIIQKNQAFIAGSALIHALHLENHWKPNDIDVWTNNIKNIDIKNNLLFKKPATSEQYTNNEYGSISVHNIKGTIININEIYNYIHISPVSCVRDKIINNFDYDFLKASFDGKELIIYNSESILSKKSICSRSKLVMNYLDIEMKKHEKTTFERHQKRVVKYIERGFIITKCICSCY